MTTVTATDDDASTVDEAFHVKDCDLITIATGKGARNLREFRAYLQDIHPGSLYYHFWSALLRTHEDREYREYNNDFARWARFGLLDATLAERLAIVDPAGFETLDDLRTGLLDLIDQRIHEAGQIPPARPEEEFHFIRAQLVVFDTDHVVGTPGDLPETVEALPPSSIFYHFVDARSRSPAGLDDFSRWLGDDGRYAALRQALGSLDLYFTSLPALRSELADLFRRELGGER